MFSTMIVDSDAFLDMSSSAQNLYFHLGMRADDDGFIDNPKKVLRVIGGNDDDLKLLMAKRFILSFESGVVVIKHWLIHNLIRSDLYKETLYKKEKATLGLNESGAYTELREGVGELKRIESPKWLKERKGEVSTANVPQTAHRIGKVSIGKERKENTTATASVAPKADSFFQNMRKDKLDDAIPMSLPDFVLLARGSAHRHVRLVGEYADERQIKNETRGQWRQFTHRNIAVASRLAPYNDDQLSNAISRLKDDFEAMERKQGGSPKWCMETIEKYLDQANSKK